MTHPRHPRTELYTLLLHTLLSRPHLVFRFGCICPYHVSVFLQLFGFAEQQQCWSHVTRCARTGQMHEERLAAPHFVKMNVER